ncbi:choice-of-anchor A family protein [Streptomyces cinnamoneus]|uniref:choice-of-anchor A family protein n=1 Tax=Streptomyces cinnamoneus TaxID=53446 RepID=UPI001EFC57E6|nr:choice-of-anchor A family protein [Streptomyces cinnamoneus]
MSEEERARWRPTRPAATVTAALISVGGVLLACAFTAADRTEPVPAGPGPCVPGTCPETYPEPHSGPFAGRDNGVNVFVGGDFTVRQAAGEAEGRVVTLGAFQMAKGGGVPEYYRVGAAGTGSRVPPDNGLPYLRVGGDLRIAPHQRLLAEEGTASGTVAYAGALTGTVAPKAAHDEAAVAEYRQLREELTSASTCYAYDKGVPRKATGTAVNQGNRTLFTGDGKSALQVFNVPFDLTGRSDAPQDLVFEAVPRDATVLVNLTNARGSAKKVVNSSATALVGVRRERLLWNIPDAKEIRLTGSGQLDGAVLAGRRAGLTHLTVPVVNGRFFTAGSLTHESGRARRARPSTPTPSRAPSPNAARARPPTRTRPSRPRPRSRAPPPRCRPTRRPARPTSRGGGRGRGRPRAVPRRPADGDVDGGRRHADRPGRRPGADGAVPDAAGGLRGGTAGRRRGGAGWGQAGAREVLTVGGQNQCRQCGGRSARKRASARAAPPGGGPGRVRRARACWGVATEVDRAQVAHVQGQVGLPVRRYAVGFAAPDVSR